VTVPAPTNPVFDRLFGDAVPALLAGTHRRDEPPVDGGRWPVSVVCLPDARAREVLAGVMREASAFAGPGHFETGRSDASHVTVRALEPYRELMRRLPGSSTGRRSAGRPSRSTSSSTR
jgi:hypothetical protein